MTEAYAIPSDVAQVVLEPSGGNDLRVFVMRVPDGNPVALVGISAVIWLLAAEGDIDVVVSVAEAVNEPVAEIGPMIEVYLKDLADQGLLQRLE
ncbi:hypothetical protein [Granulicoccus sp. GXG6511]|uniref:hypothetical protein n=1 Tax=Granulicoccus sp. GXG6511 TaxID=3381351 RepID=UPI003D7CB63A